MSGTDEGTDPMTWGLSTSGLVLGRPGLRRKAEAACTFAEVQGVWGLATPDLPILGQSLESCEYPILKKSDACAAADF